MEQLLSRVWSTPQRPPSIGTTWLWTRHATEPSSPGIISPTLRKYIPFASEEICIYDEGHAFCCRFILPSLSCQVHCNENPIYVFPGKELRGLSPNFHSCVCERFIYSQDQSTYFPAAEKEDRSWEYITRSRTHECECGNRDWGCAIPFLGILVSNFRYCVFAV